MPLMTSPAGHSPHTILRSALVAVAALAFGACSSDGDSKPADTLPADAIVINAGPGIQFGQPAYTAPAGNDVVALVNKDSQPHDLIIVSEDGTQLPGHLEVFKGGQTVTGNFDLKAGTYQLLCKIVGHDSMKATLTVS